jgi:hypothetical protein
VPGVVDGFYEFAEHGPEPNLYPFLSCEGKMYVTNDKANRDEYYELLWSNDFVKKFVSKSYDVSPRLLIGSSYLQCHPSLFDAIDGRERDRAWTDLLY